MMTPEDYQRILRTQLAGGLVIGVLGIAVAFLAPRFPPWLLPAVANLWAMGALPVATRLDTVGISSGRLKVLALTIGVASMVRLVYLAIHAA